MKIRKYQASDQQQLIDLWRAVFPDDPAHNDAAAVLRAKLKVDDLIFIVEDDGELMGACMAGYDGHRGWLYSVAVDENHRRDGVGSALVNEAIAALTLCGCIKINLQIRPANTAVADFYASMGFAVEQRLSMGLLVTHSA